MAEKNSPTVVLVTGVFDLLHEEHLLFLQKAKSHGDVLLVGIETDSRVRKTKGVNRPVENEVTRMQKVFYTGLADQVFLLPEKFDQPQDHLALIKKYQPDILAVSSHTPHLEAKKRIVAECGARVVVVHDWNPNISTTQILNKSV